MVRRAIVLIGCSWAACFSGAVSAEPFDDWTLLHPRMPLESFTKVLFVKDRFFALGASGSMFSSTNGLDWGSAAHFPGPIDNVAFGNERFVALTEKWDSGLRTNIGLTYLSEDGRNWLLSSQQLGASFSGLTFGQGMFVASGSRVQRGAVWSSVNGRQWTLHPVPDVEFISGIAYGGGVFLVIGGSYYMAGRRFASTAWAAASTNLLTWSVVDFHDPAQFVSVAAGTDRFVITGSAPWGLESVPGVAVFQFGPDLSWQVHRAEIRGLPWAPLTFIDGRFVSGLWSSNDGTNWTSVDARSDVVFDLVPDHVPIFSPAFGNGIWVAVGHSGTLSVSSNRVDWSSLGRVTGLPLRDLTHGPAGYVAVGGKNSGGSGWPGRGVLMTSSDGQSWSNLSPDRVAPLNSVIYAAGLFVAVGGDSAVADSGILLVSTNGIDWSERPFSPRTPLSKVVYGNGRFGAVGGLQKPWDIGQGYDWEGLLIQSTDGVNWTTLISAKGVFYEDILFAGGKFVLNSRTQRAVYSSTNLVDWSKPLEGLHFGNLAFVDGRFRVAGDPGDGFGPGVFWSTDAVDWSLTRTMEEQPEKVVFAHGLYFGLQGSNIVSSTTGVSWSMRHQWPVSLNNLVLLDDTFIALGALGTVLQSGAVGPSFARLDVGLPSPGEVRSQLRSERGKTVTIESSLDLRSWTPLLTATNVRGSVPFVDRAEFPQKFYRARIGE